MQRFLTFVYCFIIPFILLLPFESKAATIDDFTGTWSGHETYVSATWTDSGSIQVWLHKNGNVLVGSFSLDHGAPLPIQGSVIDGVFSFNVPNSEPGNPDCANFNVSAEARLSNDLQTMEVVASGTFCDEGGGELGRSTSILTKIIPMSSINFLLL